MTPSNSIRFVKLHLHNYGAFLGSHDFLFDQHRTFSNDNIKMTHCDHRKMTHPVLVKKIYTLHSLSLFAGDFFFRLSFSL